MSARPSFVRPVFVTLLTAAILLSSQFDARSRAAQPDDGSSTVSTTNAAISPKDEADALHLVVAADREAYCRAYLAAQTAPRTAESAAAPRVTWPLPAEIFRRAAESIQSQGAEFSYALRSLHPLDPRNAPQTELEQRGLVFIASHPAEHFYGRELLGGRRYLTAVYADIGASAACIECHQQRSPATRRAYRVGESMGAIVVRIPLEF